MLAHQHAKHYTAPMTVPSYLLPCDGSGRRDMDNREFGWLETIVIQAIPLRVEAVQ